MPRPRQRRKIQVPPKFKGFKPCGISSGLPLQVMLDLEEYESIRLLDYEGLSQVEAAVLMEVSRPTLTRVYESARKKIATSLTEVRPLMLKDGNATYNGNWFLCNICGSRFNVYGIDIKCPLCQAVEVSDLNSNTSC
jgi:predicted DNA-binding protein (UPF0251 family)